jgi:hypothetical protein
MKTSVLLIALSLMASTAIAEQTRLEFSFIHYSVGGGFVKPAYNAPDIRTKYLDTMRIVNQSDTAVIRLRNYYTNYEATSGSLSDTTQSWYFPATFTYDLRYTSSLNRIGINEAGVATILTNLFRQPNAARDTARWWKIFKTHKVPGRVTPTDSVSVKYDVVMIKNQYDNWGAMTQLKVDSIKARYQQLLDTLSNHPEINFGMVFGTPLRLGSAYVQDSATAHLTYSLASWFADSFFVHDNFGQYKNVWKLDPYRQLCEMGNQENKWCLDSAYWAGDIGSHLNLAGYSMGQDTLAGFIRSIATDILLQRNNVITRGDIDAKIRDFRGGLATENDVYQLIYQYINQ